MPIETAIKRRMHRSRTAHVIAVVNRVVRLVRVFLADALHREAREMRGLGLIEWDLLWLRLLGHRGVAEANERNSHEKS